jgi:iron complex outermembrane receptor protein
MSYRKQLPIKTVLKGSATTLPVSLIFFNFTVFANDVAIYSEDDFLEPIPSVEAATRYSMPLSEAPSSVTLISREMIDAMPMVNFVDVLKLVPGFQVFFANGSIQATTINGQSDRFPRRLEIRVDGRSVYTPINSSVSWESLGLDSNDIAYIEVVRGSNVAAYGTNAVQGAVNIVTRNPLTDSGTEVRLTTGDWHTRNTSIRHSFKGETAAYTLRVNYRENQGFSGLDDQSYADSAVLQGVYTPSLFNEFQWELGYSDGNFGFGDGDRPEEFTDEDIATQWFALSWKHQQGRHTYKLNSAINLGTYERSQQVLLTEELDISPNELYTLYPGQNDKLIEIEEGEREYQQYDIEWQHHIALNSANHLLWGAGARHQSLNAPAEFGNDSDSSATIYFLFGNIDWSFNRHWRVNLSVMTEDHEHRDTKFSPRLSLKYQLNQDHHFRVSTSVAYRQPSLYEQERLIQRELDSGLIADLIFISDPDLGSEKFQTYELAYLGYWFNKKLSLDYRLFREYLDDEVLYVKHAYDDINSKFRQLENADSNRTSGYETQIQWRPDNTWLIAAQYYNTRMLKKVRSPEHIASMLLSKRFAGNWQISGTFYHQSEVNWLRGTSVASWHRYDLKVSKGWHLNGSDIDLALIVQNMSDEEYVEYQAGNAFEQLTFISLKVSF